MRSLPQIPFCPKCFIHQECPCEHCAKDEPACYVMYDGDIGTCSNCGHRAHIDTWMDYEGYQLERYQNEQKRNS